MPPVPFYTVQSDAVAIFFFYLRKILCLYQVGSGKSSLLNTIIGETHVISGSVSSCGSIAYVPQVAFYDVKIA
jgi:ABC-type branched-subunit amino acid transport system ATPase component